MNKKFEISARGTGKVNKKGEIQDYKLISHDFTSLYPNSMGDFSEFIRKLKLRQERKEKLERIEKKAKEND